MSVDGDEPNLLLPSGVLDVTKTGAIGVMLGHAVIAVRSDRQAVGELVGYILTTFGAEESALILAAAVKVVAKDAA